MSHWHKAKHARPKQLNEQQALATTRVAYYLSAIVLGLNDALVELTGALAGFTIILQNNDLIILSGLTTGIAATLSMAAAEFLAQKTAGRSASAKVAALYTGIAYLVTVVLLLLPYVLIKNPFAALGCCITIAATIILLYTFVSAKILKRPFLHEFLQMLIVSVSVALIAFSLSWVAKTWWGININ